MGGGGDESSGFDAAFAFDGIEADEVEGDVFEQSQVVCGGLLRARIWSSLKITSITQWSRFSTDQ